MADSLRFVFEWEPIDQVRAPELRATWARLEIWLGDECLSHVEDLSTRTARRSIYGSLYPLAEWVAYNWWQLQAHVRPAALSPRYWTYASPAPPRRYARSWLNYHNLRAVGDGQAWPDMTLLPEGRQMRIVWRHDRPPLPEHRTVRFLAEGESIVEPSSVSSALSKLIEAVLTRLAEANVHDTPLEKEWNAVTQQDQDEVEFCIAASRLGLDPYSLQGDVARLIEESGERLEARLLSEFLDAVSPGKLAHGLSWITSTSDEIADFSGGASSDDLRDLTASVQESEPLPSTFGQPWEIGWAQARSIRSALNVDQTKPLSLGSLVSTAQKTSEDRRLEALGGRSNDRSSVVFLGRDRVDEAVRFVQARALWHLLFEQREVNRFLLTPSQTYSRRIERAFAAELMAPAEGIRAIVDGSEEFITHEDLERAGSHFRISHFVIRHQIENQLELELATPD